jgi:hypothetical protein
VVIPTRSVWFPGGEILSSSQGPEGKAPGPHAIGTAALASISNSRTAVDAGWASDDARVEFDSKTRRFNLIVGLAVRDSDGYVHRVAYTVTMLGVLMPR